MREKITNYCATIGRDSLLVQGAGGNVSWKEDDILWVKASGTWLAEAREKNIFVSVDLKHLRQAFSQNNFIITPIVTGNFSLRSSIETALHALMPQKVVVHLHAIEILAHLVRRNAEYELQNLLKNKFQWNMVDYHKPGASLAAAVNEALKQKPNIDIIFLKNHGVVVGGESVEEVKKLIEELTCVLSIRPIQLSSRRIGREIHPYVLIDDPDIQQLALNPVLFEQLNTHWALYPDHVVFLGPKAHTYLTWQDVPLEKIPELIFVKDAGVYTTPSFSQAKKAQLRCYYDIISRQEEGITISTLTNKQIAELLDWDAEKYRINLER